MLKRMLQSLGYKVTSFSNSIEAFNEFEKKTEGFDLVITDITMPKMTGIELAQKILSLKADMPVVVCTGYSDQINKEKAESLGIKGYLLKPVSKVELAHLIRDILDAE